MEQKQLFDAELVRKYDREGPRYTSYPTAVQFHTEFGEQQYREAVRASNAAVPARPLSLYFHLPFCNTVCYYCACNKIVTKDRSRAGPYLERLHREIRMQGELFDPGRSVDQLHWGGGTPTFISHEEMRTLMRVTGEHFRLRNDDEGEYSIEIDPREVQADTVALLRELGFNRMSLGVQDFDSRVQEAVNRVQTEEQTVAVIDAARRYGFKSVSIDLIYGLPFQSVDSFLETLHKVISMAPDRLSVFNYAHLPERFKPQRRINAADLPPSLEKLAILQGVIDCLTVAGYIYVGMDHFARPEDELVRAQHNGTLYRNFQGYSTHADCDLVAMGVSSISKVGDTFAQNVRVLEHYDAAIDDGHLPIFRGYRLNTEDRLRQRIIMELICHFTLDIDVLENETGIVFSEHFAGELDNLQEMVDDGLLELDAHSIRVLPPGRLLVRNLCMVFDEYQQARQGQAYSRVI